MPARLRVTEQGGKHKALSSGEKGYVMVMVMVGGGIDKDEGKEDVF